MAPQHQELASKERSLFTQVVKNYENKQYKKGLKAADQILKKRPDHGDTLAMKALIINGQGHTDEAFALAKVALQKAMKSHICWHVYGLLYRTNKNFEEAIKAYKFALKLEPESHQIQKDLALLQMQMRDYQGYIQSRLAILQNRTTWRQNWTALAVAQHLAGDLFSAERTLTTYEETLKSPPPKTDVEHAEAVLYKNSIIAEMGETERALEHLDAAAKNNPDRGWVMEKRAEYLLKLGRKEEAEKAYRALLARNAEYRVYYDGLVDSMGIDRSDTKALRSLYQEFAQQNPRGDAAKRIPLDFLEGDDFREAADEYLQLVLHKGIPSAFANLKALYSNTTKRDTIRELVEGYAAGKVNSHTNGTAEKQVNGYADQFEISVQYFLAQHYDYRLSRDLSEAMKHIDNCINSRPESVDYHMTKARIWKHFGNSQKAAEAMEKGRALDERDRYINTKAAKYQLRNGNNEAAIKNMSKFTRNEAPGGPLGDLHDMQCQWFIYEDGMSNLRQDKIGLALKRFHAIYNIFETWQEDQFDFHSFSLKKGQIRAYIDMIRWEDTLREHPFFSRAAIAAAKIYIRLHDDPTLAKKSLSNGLNGDHMGSAERKKAQKKARKEQEKLAQAEAEKRDAKKTAGVDSNGEPKKEDKDANGEQLLQTAEPLTEAMKFITPLLDSSPKDIKAQEAAFEVFIRREKFLLALHSLLQAHSLAPASPITHLHLITFRHKLSNLPPTFPFPEKVQETLSSALEPVLPKSANLAEYNTQFLQSHHTSAPHVHAALAVRQMLGPEERGQKEDLIRTLALDGAQLEDAVRGLELLREWKADSKLVGDYVDAARVRYPEASFWERTDWN